MAKLDAQWQHRRKQLRNAFQALHTKTPDWAWPFVPSIPFVGKRYRPGHGLLIYASAENLSWMNRKSVPARFQEPAGWDRYRACLEEKPVNRSGFFPNIGIAPVSNGALLSAGLYVAHRRGLPARKTPASFIETLAVSNWCKFSVQDTLNRDHVGDLTKLAKSLSFVIAELSLLRPKVVLLPRTIWRHTILAEAMRGASWTTEFLPAPQFNAPVVNIHLKGLRFEGNDDAE